MNTLKITSLLTTLIAVGLLTACGGGGGNLEDGQTPLRTEGQSVTLQSATASCPPASAGVTIFVFGGVAPYSLRNTAPQQVALSTGIIGKPGEGVNVRFLGGCLTNIPLVFVDQNGATVTVPLNYLPANS